MGGGIPHIFPDARRGSERTSIKRPEPTGRRWRPSSPRSIHDGDNAPLGGERLEDCREGAPLRSEIATLADFTPRAPLEHAVPLDPLRPAITNFQLVRILVEEAFAKDPRAVLLLTSNGSLERPATEFYLRRVVN